MIDWKVSVNDMYVLRDEATCLARVYDMLTAAVTDVIADKGEQIIAPFRAVPGGPKYPLRWKSRKQRAFVMAKLRAENNLPYKRTGALAAGWQLNTALDPSQRAIRVEAVNPSAVEKFVSGDYAQPFHIDTGWMNSAATAQAQGDYVEEAIFTRFKERLNGK